MKFKKIDPSATLVTHQVFNIYVELMATMLFISVKDVEFSIVQVLF